MPPFIAEIFLRIRAFFQNMADEVMIIYAEKGIEPFKKPLAVAVPSILVLYIAVYSPMGDKVKRAEFEIGRMTAVAESSGEYKDAKSRLTGYQRKLPLIKDKDEWLNYLLNSSGKKYNITFDGLSAQSEAAAGNFLIVSRDISAITTYDNLGRWVAEIENSPIFIRVGSFSVERDSANPGRVKVKFTVSTVFAKAGAT